VAITFFRILFVASCSSVECSVLCLAFHFFKTSLLPCSGRSFFQHSHVVLCIETVARWYVHWVHTTINCFLISFLLNFWVSGHLIRSGSAVALPTTACLPLRYCFVPFQLLSRSFIFCSLSCACHVHVANTEKLWTRSVSDRRLVSPRRQLQWSDSRA
jgi:hypothetical protein